MANYTQRPRGASAKGKKKSAGRRFVGAIIPMKGDSFAEILRKVIFIGAVVAFAITGGGLLFDVGNELVQIKKTESIQNQMMNGTVDIDEEVVSQIQEEVPDINIDFVSLYATNKDTVGWIQIGDVISYPVVQCEDNSYYLEHNFEGDYSKSGTIFADYRNIISAVGTSDNIILYGHNLWSSTMFSKVTRYYYDNDNPDDRLKFYRENPTITFNTIYDESEWKVFACGLYNTNKDDGEVYNYIGKREFETEDDFNQFILDVMDRSCFFTDVDITYGDDLLTLSTCYMIYNNETVRCVVFARKVRDGESAEVDTSVAVTNYNRLLFQLEIDRGVGKAWTTRTWDTSKLLSYNG